MAYGVFQKKGTKPTKEDCNISHWQLVKAMIEKGVVDPDPLSQVLTGLAALIKTSRRSGYKIILMMDANNTNNPGTQ